MLKVINNKIMINRGDIGPLAVTAKNQDGSDYIFQNNDVVRFKIVKANDHNIVILQKDVQIDSPKISVNIDLTSEDTTIGDIINTPINYWYEVELNPDTAPQTIIGYDDKGPKLFVLYPEGGEFKND